MDDHEATALFKHVQQQRRSGQGRRRSLYTNLTLHFSNNNIINNSSNNKDAKRSARPATGDCNHSTNNCEEASIAGKRKSVQASRRSLKTEREDEVIAICGPGNQIGADSPLDSNRAATAQKRAMVPCERLKYEGEVTIMCSRLNDDADSATSEGLAVGSWLPGQLVWAKLCHFPWWPAQVIDARHVENGSRPQRLSKDDVLVRFFGIYNIAWVDPLINLSTFDMNFEERSCILKKAFQKGLKEALEYRDSRRLPESWTMPMQAHRTEECDIKPNGVEFSEDGNSHEKLKVDGPYRTGASRKRKPKMLYEEEERLHRKPDRKVRRRRIMRDLGLAAPYGSPFALNNFSRTM